LAGRLAVLGSCPWALEEGGVPSTSVLPWRQLSMVAFVLAVPRYAVLADRGPAGEPEDASCATARPHRAGVVGDVRTCRRRLVISAHGGTGIE
jgi:hypothetical protein